MLKLLLCLACSMVLAVLLLHLRQQRLELNHDAIVLHNKIESQQAQLWSQQLQIAVCTAPNAISKTVGEEQLKLVPQSPLPPSAANWIESRNSPQSPAQGQ